VVSTKVGTLPNCAISSCHSLATQVAADLIAAGGNVIDAAVAGAFVLQVVEPHLNGPAGELVALIDGKDTTGSVCVGGVGAAPAAATIEEFHSLGYDVIPALGVRSAPVPGQFHALITLLERFGTLTLEQALTPAQTLARQGFPVTASLHEALVSSERGAFNRWPRTRQFWIPRGVPAIGAYM